MDRVLASRTGSRSRRCRRAGVLLALTTGLGAVGTGIAAPVASAQDDPAIVRTRDEVQRAQAEANAAHARYQNAINERDRAQRQIGELEAAIPALRAQEAELRAREVELRAQLGTRAAALYKNAEPFPGLEVLAAKDRMNAGRRTKLTEAADDFECNVGFEQRTANLT